MTKAELIANVCVKMGHETSNALAGRAVQAVLDAIAEALKDGHEVPLTGIGKFKVKTRAARKGRNPKTGEEIAIPAKKALVFSVAKDMREALK